MEIDTDSYTSIHRKTYEVTIGIFFGISVLTLLARLTTRLTTQRRLALDDYFLIFALACLCVSAAMLFVNAEAYFLDNAIQHDVTLAYRLTPKELDMVINGTTPLKTFLCLAWTAIFCVKFSFLAFFYNLIDRVRGIRIWYWSVVVFTIVTWMFLVSEPFILCPYSGVDSLKCLDPSRSLLNVSLTGFITGLDCLTDIMIVSIPVIILRQSNLKFRQKMVLGIFLCLSLVMVAMAITRVSKVKNDIGTDVPWSLFWQFMEAAVAVFMASLTTFRTAFVKHNQSGQHAPPPLYSYKRLLRGRKNKSSENDFEDTEIGHLPQVPRPTMTGLGTFIRGYNRSHALHSMDDTLCGSESNRSIVVKKQFSVQSTHESEVSPPSTAYEEYEPRDTFRR
ncbi:hypothetical protein EJ05DRAFT_512766 [Pseudovirgaria hyperparasitica]|uniref:Rhodopsin domain-containing protein n=1 Tax=Pseudovirgaria hyperparasitica TaxID=470096 RepID=A0A6A6W2H5_9PEZI|nr:uncharacterized protein EJ05DRAFT_512766 [Pseudovirgaria hyperparasitica]KAF2756236.1 hypothetical protein EJ05DRAFT_512766 [Pseudovirgaria hyperparasitica]